jgi:hypothetical protein
LSVLNNHLIPVYMSGLDEFHWVDTNEIKIFRIIIMD